MRTLQLLLCFSLVLAGQAQVVHPLTASNYQFSPQLFTIASGDTVRLALGPGHSFTEVPEDAWSLNLTSPAIGWDIGPFNEATTHDLVLTSPDTLYYVCVPHISMGMKGRIVVQASTVGITEAEVRRMHIFPNPATGHVQVSSDVAQASRIRVVDGLGRTVQEAALNTHGTVDLHGLATGHYEVLVLSLAGRVLHQHPLIIQP